MTAAAAGLLLLREIRDHAVGREQEARDGRRVLEGAARDLRRIDDAGLQEVAVLAGADVVAVRAGRLLDVGDDERGFLTRIIDKLAERRLDRTGDDVRADLLVPFELEGLDGLLRNRVRRRLREIYRLNSDKLRPGVDIVIVARSRCIEAEYAKMERAFLRACAELGILRGEEK